MLKDGEVRDNKVRSALYVGLAVLDGLKAGELYLQDWMH